MASQAQPKWKGKLTTKLEAPITPDQVWPLFEDFCAISKWLPGVVTSYHVEGVYGQPGLIRYCATEGDESTRKWCKEKLVAYDPTQRSFTYQILENTTGFKSYEATFKFLEPIDGGDDDQKRGGCLIEWSYVADPDETNPFTPEAFCAFVDSTLQGMGERVVKALKTTK